MRRNDPNETSDIHNRKLLSTRCHQLHSDSLLLDVWREMIWLSHLHACIYIIFMYLKTIMILLFSQASFLFPAVKFIVQFCYHWVRQFSENISLACLPPRNFDHLKYGITPFLTDFYRKKVTWNFRKPFFWLKFSKR